MKRVYQEYSWAFVTIIMALALATLSIFAFRSRAVTPDLRNAALSNANLRGKDLSHIDLSGADLRGADLTGADLREANLTGVQLTGAKLRQADLGGTNLYAANVRRTDLSGALNLTREQVDSFIWDQTTILPEVLQLPVAPPDGGNGSYDFTEVAAIPVPYVPDNVALSRDGSVVAVVGQSLEVQGWRLGEDRTVTKLPTMIGHTRNASSVAVSPDGQVVASGCEDGAIRLWRVGETAPFATLRGGANEGLVFKLDFSSDGKTLVSASLALPRDEKTIHFWQVESGESMSSILVGSNERVFDIEPNLRLMVVTGQRYGGAQIRSLPDNLMRTLLEDSRQDVTDAAFNPDGKSLAMGVKSGTRGAVQIWNVDGGRLATGPFAGPEGEIESLTFSPDGKLVAAGWSEGSILLWRVSDGFQLTPLTHRRGPVYDVTFSAGGDVFASAAGDQTFRLWRVKKY